MLQLQQHNVVSKVPTTCLTVGLPVQFELHPKLMVGWVKMTLLVFGLQELVSKKSNKQAKKMVPREMTSCRCLMASV